MLALLLACSGTDSAPKETPASPRKVLVLGWDGTRPDALDQANTPAMHALAERGASSWQATTQLTSVTASASGWTSILTGVESAKHQVFANGVYDYKSPDYPTFLWRARQAGFRTAVATHWADIADGITEEDALDMQFIGDDAAVAAQAAAWITQASADIVFVQLDDVDHAGHTTAFSPEDPGYMAAIEATDAHSKTILDALATRPASEEWLVIATTDHGGDGANGHGGLNDACRTIYFFASGPGISPGTQLANVSHMDTATTVLAWLGLGPETSWGLDGQVQVSAP